MKLADRFNAHRVQTDQNNGQYLVAYATQQLGTASLSVTINGVSCANMPLTVSISPG